MSEQVTQKENPKATIVAIANSVRQRNMALATKPPEGLKIGHEVVGTYRTEHDDWSAIFFDNGMATKDNPRIIQETEKLFRLNQEYSQIKDDSRESASHSIFTTQRALPTSLSPLVINVRGRFPHHYDQRQREVLCGLNMYLEFNSDEQAKFLHLFKRGK